MNVLGPREMQMVFSVTDELGIHREAVRVPLAPVPGGSARIESGVLVLELPADRDLGEWLATTATQIPTLDGFAALPRA